MLLKLPILRERMRTPLLSYSIGMLLAAVFIGLLPQALQYMDAAGVFKIVLSGLLFFFVLEKILRIPHMHAHSAGHTEHGSSHLDSHHPAGTMILIGDTLHNFADGILIAAAFFASTPLGVMTAVAVIAHEIPQELGDFVILLESGIEPKKAYFLNFLSSLATLAGALLAYTFRSGVEAYLPHILALSAANFLYIGTVDLAPILHHHIGLASAARQTVGLLAGAATLMILHSFIG